MNKQARIVPFVMAFGLGCAPIDDPIDTATSAIFTCSTATRPRPLACVTPRGTTYLDTYPLTANARSCVQTADCSVRYVRGQAGGEVSIIGVNNKRLAAFNRWVFTMCPTPQPSQPPAPPPTATSRADDGSVSGGIGVACCLGRCVTYRYKL